MENNIKRYFIVEYNSKDNLFKGERILVAFTVGDAQTKFFDWLKTQSVYPHMYSLSVEFHEIRSID